jgi:hypothetical protein
MATETIKFFRFRFLTWQWAHSFPVQKDYILIFRQWIALLHLTSLKSASWLVGDHQFHFLKYTLPLIALPRCMFECFDFFSLYFDKTLKRISGFRIFWNYFGSKEFKNSLAIMFSKYCLGDGIFQSFYKVKLSSMCF